MAIKLIELFPVLHFESFDSLIVNLMHYLSRLKSFHCPRCRRPCMSKRLSDVSNHYLYLLSFVKRYAIRPFVIMHWKPSNSVYITVCVYWYSSFVMEQSCFMNQGSRRKCRTIDPR